MKKITCRKCEHAWYTDSQELDKITYCPYCGDQIRKKATITKVESLDQAIYLAITNLGSSVLSSPTRITGYISDVAPHLKKELRILSHSFRDEYFSIVKQSFSSELPQAENHLKRLVRMLIEEEGMSDNWAKLIGVAYLRAIKLTRGIGLSDIFLADVEEYEVQKTIDTIDFDESFAELLAISGKTIDIGDKIIGTIIKIDNYYAELDLGTKHTAYLQFTQPNHLNINAAEMKLKVGDEVECYVISKNDEYNTIELSLNNPALSVSRIPPANLKDSISRKDRKVDPKGSFAGFKEGFAIPPKAYGTSQNTAQKNEDVFVCKGSALQRYNGNEAEVVIPEGVTSIGFRAFYQNKSIKKVVLPEALINIDMEAFSDCCNLACIEFNRTLWQIGVKAFSNCTNLKKVVFPDLIRIIGVEAFANCTSLETVRLPRELVSLNEKVFSGCKRLETIVVPNSNLYIDKKALPAQINIEFE